MNKEASGRMDYRRSDETEEQVDFDGDNDNEDIMDDEEVAYDETPQKLGNKYGQKVFEYEDERVGNESDGSEREYGDEYVNKESNHEEPTSPETSNVAGSLLKNDVDVGEDEVVDPSDGVDREKWAELLALPPHGTEVFIGGLPRDTMEEELRGLCEPFGEVFEVRLMKDKDRGESKGFAFVTFMTKEAAQEAIEGVHDKDFKGRKLRCSLSQAKHRLFVGNVPKSLSEEELRKILEENSPGIENIEYFKDPQNLGRNRGFLFVEYYNYACADYARQKMSNENFKIDGSTPTISWADPKNSSESSAAAQIKCVYVKNLPENVKTEKLKELFEGYGEVTKVVLPPAKAGQSKRGFGFVHFAERSSALKAVKTGERFEIDGHVLEAVLARPQSEKRSDYASNSPKPALFHGQPSYQPYGYPGDLYGAYGGRPSSGAYGQPMIYGRGLMPTGMKMVPMVLPDGRIGYVLQQPGMPGPPPAPPSRRPNRHGGPSEGGDRGGGDGGRGRRYRPY